MNDQVANILLTFLNLAISRAQNDPIALAKIQRGEPLTRDDVDRLGAQRDAAGDELDRAIEEAQ